MGKQIAVNKNPECLLNKRYATFVESYTSFVHTSRGGCLLGSRRFLILWNLPGYVTYLEQSLIRNFRVPNPAHYTTY